MKYEIMNIKQIILGTILSMEEEEKRKKINFLVEEYLDNTDFIEKLLKLTSLGEIQLFMKKTVYNIAIREGILYFKNNNEVFVLEAFLDQIYYNHLKQQIKILNKKESVMISLFIKYKTEIYNLNIIYRGIKNNIERKLLSQFLVKNYLFLDEDKLQFLLNLDDVEIFATFIEDYIRNIKEIKPFFLDLKIKRKHLIQSIEEIYFNYYFKKFKIKIDDIDFFTIYKILELLIRKEKEIRFDIMPRAVKILHKKFKDLKLRKDIGYF